MKVGCWRAGLLRRFEKCNEVGEFLRSKDAVVAGGHNGHGSGVHRDQCREARQDVDLNGLATTDLESAGAVLLFVRTQAEADVRSAPVVAAANGGKIAWMAYPKARQLGTDLNRDILWKLMKEKGIEANRQISIDDVWSAMRFRARG